MRSLETRLRDAIDNPGTASSDFDLNTDVVLPKERKLRPAGVLMLFSELNGEAQVLLTKRSSALKHHPGQIAFPGGKQDALDTDVTACALREAQEEVGLPSSHAEVLGHLPKHETVTGFLVTPVLALLQTEFLVVPEFAEVDDVFWVPLKHVQYPGNFTVQTRRWQGRARKYYAIPYGPYYIWGATARMLRGFAEALA